MTSNGSGSTRILGSVRTHDGRGVVRMEERFDTDIDDLWSAVTDPARLARWYGQIEGDLRVGGEFRAHVFASGWEGTGRIEACEPPRHLVTVSRDPDEPNEGVTEVTLTPDGDQTILVFEHRGVPPDLLYAYGVGEQIHVEDLADYIAGRERRDAEARWKQLEPFYRDLAAGVG
jgi:uncharacterized protein YndB with AHSA1/START domain